MLREKRLDHSNPNLRSVSKAVQPQPKCVHSGRYTSWIFLSSMTLPIIPPISWVAKKCPVNCQSSHRKLWQEQEAEFRFIMIQFNNWTLSLEAVPAAKSWNAKGQRKCYSKDWKQIPIWEKQFPKSVVAADRTTGKNEFRTTEICVYKAVLARCIESWNWEQPFIKKINPGSSLGFFFYEEENNSSTDNWLLLEHILSSISVLLLRPREDIFWQNQKQKLLNNFLLRAQRRINSL